MTSAESGPVLVLDDEVIIALDLAEMVREAGYEVLGPFHASETALAAIDEGAAPRLAILDVNLGRHGTSAPVAERLRALGCDFVFLTGYNVAGSEVIAEFPEVPRLPKPIDYDSLTAWLQGQKFRQA